MSATDPFIVVRDEVATSLSNAQALFQRWEELYNHPHPDQDEFKWTTEELRTNLKSIEWDLEDLTETVQIVEANPAKFKLDAGEVAKRRQFVTDSVAQVKKLQEACSKSKVEKKQDSANRSDLVGRGKYSRYEKLEREIQNENQQFIEGEQQTQHMIMNQQDSQLQEVSQTVGQLKNMSIMIRDELDEHNEMLDDLDMEMSTTGDRLKRTLHRLDQTLAITKDGKQSCCIFLLLIVVIILIIVYVS